MSAPTLVEFVTARLDEDEAAANRSKGDVAMGETLNIPPSWLTGVADRVLATVAAHRAIVTLARDAEAHTAIDLPKDYMRATLGALASIWADHPDFDEQWRT